MITEVLITFSKISTHYAMLAFGLLSANLLINVAVNLLQSRHIDGHFV